MAHREGERVSETEDRSPAEVPVNGHSESAPTLPGSLLFRLAALVVVVAGLKSAGSVLLPFLLSILLAVLAMPVVRWLQGLRVPGPAAVGLTVLGLVGLFAGFGVIVGTSVQDFTKQLQTAQTQQE